MIDIKRIEEFFENAISNIYSVDNAYSCTSADRDATAAEIKEAETVRDAVLAALAEEPEWEYMNRFGSLVTFEEHATVKRRKAGPWEPLEN